VGRAAILAAPGRSTRSGQRDHVLFTTLHQRPSASCSACARSVRRAA